MDYDYFISYCSTEKEIAIFIYLNLKVLGFEVWFDNNEIKLSEKIKNKIFQGLDTSKAIIVVISNNFLLREWPMVELNYALTRESKEKVKLLIPMLYQINLLDYKEKLSILEDRSYHLIINGISENNNLWLAKIISKYFQVDFEDIILSILSDSKFDSNDFKILKSLINYYNFSPYVNNIIFINVFNIGAYAMYLHKKYNYTVNKDMNVAYNYLKSLLNIAYDFSNDITIYHILAAKKCSAELIRMLLYYYNN